MTFLRKAQGIFKKTQKQLKHYRKPNDFAKAATDILSDSDIHLDFNSKTIQDILSLKKLPPQNYTQRNFSDAPLTLFRDEKFFLDIYFWRHSDTDIHSHHFTGAFKMMAGKQHQFLYDFQKEKRILPFLEQGKINHKKNYEIFAGDTTEIVLGDDFIHQTIHDNKQVTVNLCLRTPVLGGHDLYSFRLPHFKLKNIQYSSEKIVKLLLIKSLPDKERMVALKHFVTTLSLFELVAFYRGNSYAAPYIDDYYCQIAYGHIKKNFPKEFSKLKEYLGESAKPLNMHRMLRFFVDA